MAPTPSREERPLGPNELLVCVIDPTARITSADPAFSELTGLQVGEALHVSPGYDRWNGLWVVAVTVPLGAGTCVVGFGPTTSHFEVARARQRISDRAETGAVAASADLGRLVSATARTAEHELDLRAAFLEESAAVDRVRPVIGGDPWEEAVRATVAIAGRMRRRLARFTALPGTLPRTSGFLEELAESIRLAALNAILAAHRLREGDAIGSVAGLMQARSDEVRARDPGAAL